MTITNGEACVVGGWGPIKKVRVDDGPLEGVGLKEGWLSAVPETEEVSPVVAGESEEVLEPEGGGAPLKTGSAGRTRTYNPSVNSRMLYH